MKRFWTGFTGIILAAAIVINLTGCSRIVITTGDEPELLFSVGQEECTMREAVLYLTTLKNEYTDFYGVDFWEVSDGAVSSDATGNASDDMAADTGVYDNDLFDYIKDKTMYRLQHIYCMYLLAQAQGTAISKDEKNAISEAACAYMDSLDADDIEALGITQEDVRDYYERYAYACKVFDDITKGVDIEISDDTARVVESQIIFTDDAQKSNEIKELIAAGYEFSSVAARASLSYTSRFVARGDLPEDVEEALFSLADGQTSDCITTDEGYYFVHCVSVMDSERTQENRAKILNEAYEDTFDEIYYDFISSLSFDIDEEAWEAVDLSDIGSGTADFFTVYNEYVNED